MIKTLHVNGTDYTYYPIDQVEGSEKLPYALKVLLENVLRKAPDEARAHELAQRVVEAGCQGVQGGEVEFTPARVLFQDFTGVPVFVDFAAMREAMEALGGDPAKVNPLIPCDLVIDHSVIADEAGCAGALEANMSLEFDRNRERYSFLKWAQESFDNVRIVPPGSGICHQLNIERFASVVFTEEPADGADALAYFDTLVGTDSHTPTANGIGVLGWGVGGIEAEAAALGQPVTTLVPRVIGIELTGSLSAGVTAMDLALTVAQRLRAEGVVGCFAECFGEGVATLSATQRACVSNMTPEYGCTCTLFPVDNRTLDYLKLTGRSPEQVALVEAYAKAQGLWGNPAEERVYAKVIKIDLGEVARNIAGPSRPHDRIDMSAACDNFHAVCDTRALDLEKRVDVTLPTGEEVRLGHGAIAIAALTSCTTATNPAMMIAAGLLARNAHEKGLVCKPWVKTIFAPGSHATTAILERAGLLDGLNAMGFAICGYGCMSCIGNSGPLNGAMHGIADDIELASVLSGNRNFEGRISPDVSQNYLMAPANVVAYAIAGTMDFDFKTMPLGKDGDKDVYLADILPDDAEIAALMSEYVTADVFNDTAADLYGGDASWRSLGGGTSTKFAWDESSTYVRRAPYFDGMGAEPAPLEKITEARVLALLGDFITTDHISPAGSIAADSAAARYLREHGVADADFNTYGSRRGNHEVMARGTFANVKLSNMLAEGKKGGWTTDFLDGQVKLLFDAACAYEDKKVPLVVVAGKMYGSGSSRDWAAKGPALLGVRAVIAESFERIHRSNLIGMGILPLQFMEGESREVLGLDGTESYSIGDIDFGEGLPNPRVVQVVATRPDGEPVSFDALVRIDTPTEGAYYRNGGILPYVLRNLASEGQK